MQHFDEPPLGVPVARDHLCHWIDDPVVPHAKRGIPVKLLHLVVRDVRWREDLDHKSRWPCHGAFGQQPSICDDHQIGHHDVVVGQDHVGRSKEDNAGARVTPDTLARADAAGLRIAAHLDRNDAYGFFEPLGDLVVTGPTHTNVNDFRALLIL